MSYPNQPKVPYLYMEIGDYSSQIPNNHLQDFSYTRDSGTGVNKFEATIYDETGYQIEQNIIDGREDVKFRYGWTNGAKSPMYNAMILDYSMNIDNAAATLSINGMSNIASSHSEGRKFTYTDENDNAMPIKDIIMSIADREGWDVKASEIPEMEEVKNSNDERKTFIQDNQPSTLFIKNKLMPYAKTKDSGKSGFMMYFEDKGEKPTLNFRPVSYTSPKKTYKINTRDTNVISFSPDFSGKILMSTGASTIHGSYTNSLSNDMFSVENRGIPYDRQEVAENKTYDNKSTLPAIKSSSSEDEAEKEQNFAMNKSASEAYSAELEIFGDVELKVFSTVEIINVLRSGKLHHTSGIYFVREVKDSIDAGNFTSKLDLIRESSKRGPQSSKGDIKNR